MSRVYRFVLLPLVLAGSLACGLITKPISDAKNLAATAEALASAMPLETLQALPSQMPDAGQYLNPVGAPLKEWNGIPVMPQATAGQEVNATTYSFKANAAVAEAKNYYDTALPGLGWSRAFSAQTDNSGAQMLFTKESSFLSITITPTDNQVVVFLVSQ